MTELQQAEKNLADYVATLSPERQAWANNLRTELDSLQFPDRMARIVRGITESWSELASYAVIEHVKSLK